MLNLQRIFSLFLQIFALLHLLISSSFYSFSKYVAAILIFFISNADILLTFSFEILVFTSASLSFRVHLYPLYQALCLDLKILFEGSKVFILIFFFPIVLEVKDFICFSVILQEQYYFLYFKCLCILFFLTQLGFPLLLHWFGKLSY